MKIAPYDATANTICAELARLKPAIKGFMKGYTENPYVLPDTRRELNELLGLIDQAYELTNKRLTQEFYTPDDEASYEEAHTKQEIDAAQKSGCMSVEECSCGLDCAKEMMRDE